MDIKISIDLNDYKSKSKIFETLKNHRHLRILLILDNNKMSTQEIHEIIGTKEHIYAHIENTYQAIEKLVKTGLVKKEYDPIKKKIVYSKNV